MALSNSSPARVAMMAMPWRPRSPLRMMASPGRMLDGATVRGVSITPSPAVVTYRPSPLPRSTTLVSPVTMPTPAAAAAACIEATTFSSVAMGKPSSRMKPALSQSGRAPHMQRSLTVPLTAILPMSLPGKNSGLTTCESVVNASRPPPGRRSRAPSCWASSAGFAKAGRNTRSISSCVSRPPPPWPTVISTRCGSGTGQLSPDDGGVGEAMSKAEG